MLGALVGKEILHVAETAGRVTRSTTAGAASNVAGSLQVTVKARDGH